MWSIATCKAEFFASHDYSHSRVAFPFRFSFRTTFKSFRQKSPPHGDVRTGGFCLNSFLVTRENQVLSEPLARRWLVVEILLGKGLVMAIDIVAEVHVADLINPRGEVD